MSHYHRFYQPQSTYFFTVVTFRRQKIFVNEDVKDLLKEVIQKVRVNWPFQIEGFVLLPEHLHTIWSLPEGDSNFSERWKLIKANFTREYLKKNDELVRPSNSRMRKGERTVWQRRYWEHLIRDESDFNHHLNYLHYNPVKHGLVTNPKDWPWSTFQRYVKLNWYESEWGASEPNGLMKTCMGE
ncbi:MAG: transposase [Candidatus Omnitrophota bacterium]|nr:MAG: transposase [Candidatus Omnitrophota bacterium]